MKFVFIGHGGFFNRGCEAIIRSTLIMLNKEFDQPKITISSTDYWNDKSFDFGPNVKFIPFLWSKAWKRWTWLWMIRQIYKIYSKANSWKIAYLQTISEIKKTDIVMSIGGDNYTMDYGYPDDYLNFNKLVKEKGKKLIIWGASIGPFPCGQATKEIVENLQLADLITARESHTINYLQQQGIIDKVRKVADPAFLLPSEPLPIQGILPNTSKDILGINISPILSHYRKNK